MVCLFAPTPVGISYRFYTTRERLANLQKEAADILSDRTIDDCRHWGDTRWTCTLLDRKSLVAFQRDESLSASVLGILLIWVGGFLSPYGVTAAHEAKFPLFFLLLIISLPSRSLNWTVKLLQRGSTEISYLLFNLVGVPALKQGFVITVPGAQ